KAIILHGISLHVEEKELAAVIGPNGAGKTTLFRASPGLAPRAGEILFDGEKIDNLKPVEIVTKGIILSPEGRHLFPDLTVMENLHLGAYLVQDEGLIQRTMETVLEMFPILKAREFQSAGTLSGGEQQMLTISRSLMSSPRMLLLDEPSTGLALIVKNLIIEKIKEIKRLGLTIMLVEQDVHMAFKLADRTYVVEQGKVALEGTPQDLSRNDYIKEIYLGLA
ncbi:MAG: ABC transporter ATP-binding protein, partial [Pseudomonadota bacterium]